MTKNFLDLRPGYAENARRHSETNQPGAVTIPKPHAPHQTMATVMPPENPKGGKTLTVARAGADYRLPSEALKDATENDQVFIRPGIYEDKIFLAGRTIHLVGAGRNRVTIFSRRGGPLNLQQVPGGLIRGITFRYVGSDPCSPMNLLDTTCQISACRAREGIQSGILIYGPESRPTLVDNESVYNRESGIFVFAGARPYLRENLCAGNHHFGIAVRDAGSRPDLVRNLCRHNMLSGILLFHFAEAMLLENRCRDNHQWGMVATPDCRTSPPLETLAAANELNENPLGPFCKTGNPLKEIGR